MEEEKQFLKKKKEDKIKNTEDNIKPKKPLRFWFFNLSILIKILSLFFSLSIISILLFP